MRETPVLQECKSCFAHHGITVLDPGWKEPYDLKATKGVVWRNNTGGMTDRTGRRFIRFGVNGAPDFIGFTGTGQFLGYEVKSPGKKPTELQKWFGLMIVNSGGLWGWGDSYAMCDQWLKEAGL